MYTNNITTSDIKKTCLSNLIKFRAAFYKKKLATYDQILECFNYKFFDVLFYWLSNIIIKNQNSCK